MWIARAVMIGSLRFWVIWRAESILLHLIGSTFMGLAPLGATLLPPSPKTCGLDFLKTKSPRNTIKFPSSKHVKNKISDRPKTRLGGSEFFPTSQNQARRKNFSGSLVLSPNAKEYMELTLLVYMRGLCWS